MADRNPAVMTQFEYLAVSVAILISIAVARLISGLPHALARERRYGLHCAWIIVWLWGIVMSWWGIWNYRDLEWTFVRFLMFLSPSGPVLFIAYTLVPDNAERVASWREFFYTSRKQFFGASAVFYLLLLLNQSILESIPVLDVRRLVPVVLFASALAGLASGNPRIQAVVLGVNIAVFAALFASLTYADV